MKTKQNKIGKGNKANRRIKQNRHNRLWNIQKQIAREIEAQKTGIDYYESLDDLSILFTIHELTQNKFD